MHRRSYWKWLVGLFVLGLAAGVLFFSLTAKAQQDRYCRLVGGETLTTNKDLNVGAFEFDLAINSDYRACLKMGLLDVAGKKLNFDGWVWNSNLGWTALSAEGASAPYTNSGVPVGDYAFESYVIYNNDRTGSLYGYWWNDATGWISLNCDSPNPADVVCGTSNYGGRVDVDGNVTGYAWSDSLGWIWLGDWFNFNNRTEFAGVKLPTAADMAIVPDVTAKLYPISGSGQTLPDGSPVYSGVKATYTGSEGTGYRLGLKFDFEGISLLDDFKFDFVVKLKDQTIATQINDNGNSITFTPPAADRGNDVNALLPGKTTILSNSNYGLSNQELISPKFTSRVPTTNYQTGDALFEVVSVDISKVERIDTGASEVVNNVNEINLPIVFAAPVNTELVQGESVGLNLVSGVNEPVSSVMEIKAPLDYDYSWHRVLIMEPNSDYYYCLYPNTNDADSECVIPTDAEGNVIVPPLGYDRQHFTLTSSTTVLDHLFNLYLQYFGEGGQTALTAAADGTGIYAYALGYYINSVGEYNFTNFVTGTLLANKFQVFEAEIKGNTRVDATRSILEDSGNLATSGVRAENTREAYLKYAQAITRGQKHGSLALETACKEGDANTLVDLNGCGVTDTDTRQVFFVQTKGDSQAKPLIVNSSRLRVNNVDKEYIVVVIGRDVVIDGNIYFETADGKLDRSKKVVIMAFKNGHGHGGNVYVKGDVTMLQANIFADGTMFSVPTGWDYLTDQLAAGKIEPPLSDSRYSDLQNQFVMLGSLVSQNTIGGCDLDPPRLGDGRIVTERSIGAKERACLYDLNYFRYSPMVLNADGILEWPAGDTKQLAWQILNTDGEATAKTEMREKVKRTETSVGDYAIVNLEYSPPPQDPNLPKLPTGFTFSN